MFAMEKFVAFLVYMHRPSLFYLFLAFIWLNLLWCCLEPTPLRLKVDRSGPVLNCSGNESESPPGRLSPQTTSLHVLLLAPSRPPSPSYMHTCPCTCICCYVAYLRTHFYLLQGDANTCVVLPRTPTNMLFAHSRLLYHALRIP